MYRRFPSSHLSKFPSFAGAFSNDESVIVKWYCVRSAYLDTFTTPFFHNVSLSFSRSLYSIVILCYFPPGVFPSENTCRISRWLVYLVWREVYRTSFFFSLPLCQRNHHRRDRPWDKWDKVSISDRKWKYWKLTYSVTRWRFQCIKKR